MLELINYTFMQNALLGAIIGGASCGLVGVFVILMRIPFIGVAMSHSAFAGAVVGLLAGVNPLAVALLFALVSALLIGPLADKSDFDPNISIGIIFAIVLGIAFLCMGFMKGAKTEALNFIWGNILTITSGALWLMTAALAIIIIFLWLYFKQIRAVLFNRIIASAAGIPERRLYYAMLILTALVVSFSLNTIGGLLIFSLILNPSAAAYQLTYSLKMMFILSALFGIASSVAGLFFSYLFNAPTGAVIIIVSSCIFAGTLLFSPKRRIKD